MDELADILEHELETAVEVKDKPSLHRYIQLLVERTVDRRQYETGITELKSDVRVIAERMEQGFLRMDERFREMDRRFEALQKQSDDHFESLQTQMDRRFEALQTQMDRRVEAVQVQMDKRFEAVQKQSTDHFEALQTQVDRRFDDNQKRFRMMFIFITVGFTLLTTIVTLYKFLM